MQAYTHSLFGLGIQQPLTKFIVCRFMLDQSQRDRGMFGIKAVGVVVFGLPKPCSVWLTLGFSLVAVPPCFLGRRIIDVSKTAASSDGETEPSARLCVCCLPSTKLILILLLNFPKLLVDALFLK